MSFDREHSPLREQPGDFPYPEGPGKPPEKQPNKKRIPGTETEDQLELPERLTFL